MTEKPGKDNTEDTPSQSSNEEAKSEENQKQAKIERNDDKHYNLGILEFVWNVDKARNNPIKHDGITFEEAASAFFDQKALMYPDEKHSGKEDRYVLIGMSQQANLLLVAHCYREGNVIRIISAFKAGKKESDRYEKRKR